MMKHKLLNLFGLLALMVIISCQTEDLNSDENLILESSSTDFSKKATFDWSCNSAASEVNLYAGKNILVGTVKVNVVGNDYKITYNLTNNKYCLTTTHLSVVTDPSKFPVNNGGNPINGHFEYSQSHDCISSYTYTVPTSKGKYIAAHAVVNCISSTSDSTYSNLPSSVDFCITTGREINDAQSYFYLQIADGSLAGDYWAWCADMNKSINSTNGPICYEQFNVYSLLDDLSGIISLSDNIDNALWLINNANDILNKGYEYGYIQWALWKLLNNQECNSCNANLKLPSGDITIKGMELYNMAMTTGEGYQAACGEKTMVFLDDGVNQPLIISIPVTCNEVGDCEETAWGAGCNFPGNNWSTYFQYSDGAQ